MIPLDKPFFYFVKFCVFIGETVIWCLQKVWQGIQKLFNYVKQALSYVYGLLLYAVSHTVFKLFKNKKYEKRTFFSLNYYLFFYRIKYFIFGFFIALILFSAQWSADFIKRLPNPSLIESYNAGLSTHIYSRSGKLLYEIFREQNRTPVKLDNLPPYVKWATIAIEDKDFYRHQGVSVIGGMLRAAKETLFQNKLQGGSTITQQLVKSALLTPERTVERKIKEVVLALIVERSYNKNQILEMYLNQVPYGGTAWGIEEASRMYFGKSARELKLPEAALLAGLPQAPSLYSPYTNPKAARSRQQSVLRRMYEDRYIDKKTYENALNTKLSYRSPKTNLYAPHFVFYVKNQLEKEYGTKTVQEGGLRVHTTLDYTVQKEVEHILNAELEKLGNLRVGNGGVLVTRPSTGEIIAMVGSKDFFEDNNGAFNVTTAFRQPGSSIKPITYTLALKRGYTAASVINDSPVRFETPGGPSYAPVNYDGRFHGPVPLRYALANSYNIPAIKVLESVGVRDFINFAYKVGVEGWVQDPSRYGLSLTLGGGETTMLELATAFGTLRNLGIRQDLVSVSRIENSVGQVMFEETYRGKQVMSEEEPFIVSDILADSVARRWAFGQGSVLDFGNGYVSVKTGTTDEKKDNWTIGYTRPTVGAQYSDILVAVWVGNNDNTPMHPSLTSGITGAAPIWRRVMERLVSSELFKEKLYVPENIEKKTCFFGRIEYFIKGTAQKVSCYSAPQPTATP